MNWFLYDNGLRHERVKKLHCREHVSLWQLTLTIDITHTNITLSILEKSKIKSALRTTRSC